MVKNIFIGIALLFSTFSYSQKEIYELRTYELNFGKSADILYYYIEKALIPALNKNEIYNIGVFEEIGDAMPKKLYLFIPYKSINDYYQAVEGLKRDKDYDKASISYMKTVPQDFPFLRYALYDQKNGVRELISNLFLKKKIYHEQEIFSKSQKSYLKKSRRSDSFGTRLYRYWTFVVGYHARAKWPCNQSFGLIGSKC